MFYNFSLDRVSNIHIDMKIRDRVVLPIYRIRKWLLQSIHYTLYITHYTAYSILYTQTMKYSDSKIIGSRIYQVFTLNCCI